MMVQTRCDGTQPRCKTCEVYHDECRYEKPPPMTQIVAMARRLQDAERTIRELRRALDDRSSLQARQSAQLDPFGGAVHRIHTLPVHPPAPMHVTPEARRSHSVPQSRVSSREPFTEELLSDLSLDENGKVCLYAAELRAQDKDFTDKLQDLLLRPDICRA
jgi:hypothetical protein